MRSRIGRQLWARRMKRDAEHPPPPRVDDLDPEFLALVDRVRPFTMTSLERLWGLWEACRYTLRESVPGDFVECGVWRGGSSMVMASALKGVAARRLWLFDTFEGMPPPDDRDGVQARKDWAAYSGDPDGFARSPIEDVRANIEATGLPDARVLLVAGKVEDTIPNQTPESIAVLRLDTDWYESTRHELQHLWPRLSSGGVLIVDDYGHYEGAKRATDEFFEALGSRPLFSRLDYTGRLVVKR